MKRRLSVAAKGRPGYQSKVTIRRKLASRRVCVQRRVSSIGRAISSRAGDEEYLNGEFLHEIRMNKGLGGAI
jgi:hypothetical protein